MMKKRRMKKRGERTRDTLAPPVHHVVLWLGLLAAGATTRPLVAAVRAGEAVAISGPTPRAEVVAESVALPDLVVTQATLGLPGVPPDCVTVPFQLTACVANAGEANAGSFAVGVDGGAHFDRVDSLDVSQERCINGPVESFVSEVIVDVDDEIVESDEENNVFGDVQPLPSPGPELSTHAATNANTDACHDPDTEYHTRAYGGVRYVQERREWMLYDAGSVAGLVGAGLAFSLVDESKAKMVQKIIGNELGSTITSPLALCGNAFAARPELACCHLVSFVQRRSWSLLHSMLGIPAARRDSRCVRCREHLSAPRL